MYIYKFYVFHSPSFRKPVLFVAMGLKKLQCFVKSILPGNQNVKNEQENINEIRPWQCGEQVHLLAIWKDFPKCNFYKAAHIAWYASWGDHQVLKRWSGEELWSRWSAVKMKLEQVYQQELPLLKNKSHHLQSCHGCPFQTGCNGYNHNQDETFVYYILKATVGFLSLKMFLRCLKASCNMVGRKWTSCERLENWK